VVDCYGYISTISQAAETLFGYSEEVLRGSSVRLLFPDLNDLDGSDISGSLDKLVAQNPQGYILAATSEGESRRLDL
jgi:PAS domain S-box-containing protein